MSRPTSDRSWRRPLKHPWIRHLRLHLNPLLSPIYLFGVLLGFDASGADGSALGHLDPWLGWVALHVFLYGGATAFNSFYDRDEGPVGGMLHPPGVDPGLLPFSYAVMAIGLLLAVPIGSAFLVTSLVLFVAFVAYSHPLTRWKASTWGALATIFVGQGVIGFILGWSTVAEIGGLATVRAGIAMAATGIVVTGLYVVTQAYQADEDGARGDRTLPVVWGPSRAVLAATLALAPGGAALWWELTRVGGSIVGAATAVGFAALATWMFRWSTTIERRDVTANYRTAMRIWSSSGIGLTVTLVALLAAPALR